MAEVTGPAPQKPLLPWVLSFLTPHGYAELTPLIDPAASGWPPFVQSDYDARVFGVFPSLSGAAKVTFVPQTGPFATRFGGMAIVAEAWRRDGISGQALYAFAEQQAETMGWRFNHAIKGHRVSDFPHSIHKAGDLGELDATPSSGLWILEIQIAHPTEPYGAFYEDLLLG